MEEKASLTKSSPMTCVDWEKKLRSFASVQEYTVFLPAGSAENRLYAYPDFGVYSVKDKCGRWSLVIRCGPIGLYGLGGHSHHDQLSITLCVEGNDLIRDAGTYTYTASMQQRNAYRSVRAHFAPWLSEEKEPGNSGLGPFLLGNEAKAECLFISANAFIGCHHGYGKAVYRLIRIENGCLRILDAAEAPLNLARLPLDDTGRFICTISYSPGYGSTEKDALGNPIVQSVLSREQDRR